MHRDPQTLAREMVVEVQHPVAGRTQAIGLPLKFSATPGQPGGPAPLLGGHTCEILGEMGYTPGEIEAFLSSGAARQHQALPSHRQA